MNKQQAPKPKLLEDSSSDSEASFKINTKYASIYDKFRQGEELQKLKDKYGSDVDTSSSSESEEDIPVIEKDFLKTLSLLKSKDPQIYDGKVRFFSDKSATEKKPKGKKQKPLYPKDYERKMLLETNGELSDSDEAAKMRENQQSTYDEEQEEIKKSFKAALQDSDSGSDTDDIDSKGGLLKIRQKDQKKLEDEEEDYIQWLKGKKIDVEKEERSDLSYLHDFWNDPKLGDDEKFLKDYILDKRYLDEDDDSEIPTYEEITGGIGTLSEDEEILGKQQLFEHKYNFRFEEPDEEFIKKYPRTVGESLRKKDNKRKQKREEYEERKKREKEQKKEEIRRLKALKRKEIEDKLEKLRETVGNDQLAFTNFDVDGEFDPREHDKKMKEIFDDNFYHGEETEKPEFPSDEELELENWDQWAGKGSSFGGNCDVGYEADGDVSHCEDANFNMDADYDPKKAFQQQMIESSKKKNKRHRKKSKFAEVVEKSKPVFDQAPETYDKYIDEYYKLDCEDIIGDLPVRFKYHNVVPNSFGLSTQEIWASDDRELNQWCPLKKVCQSRKEEEEMYDVQAYLKKADNSTKKRKILQKYFEQLEGKKVNDGDSQNSLPKTSTKKKRSKKMMETEDEQNCEGEQLSPEGCSTEGNLVPEKLSRETEQAIKPDEDATTPENAKRKKKKKKKKSKQTSLMKDSNICDEGGSSGIDVNLSKHNGVSHPSVDSEMIDQKTDLSQHSIGETASAKKRKRKKKKKNMPEQNENPTKKFKQTNDQQCSDKRLLIPDARLKAYGLNPKKFKGHIKFSKKNL